MENRCWLLYKSPLENSDIGNEILTYFSDLSLGNFEDTYKRNLTDTEGSFSYLFSISVELSDI